MTCSNHPDTYRSFVGRTLRGLLRNARSDSLADVRGTILVFDDGRGLFLAGNGSYWEVAAKDVQREIASIRRALQDATGQLNETLALAGEVSP